MCIRDRLSLDLRRHRFGDNLFRQRLNHRRLFNRFADRGLRFNNRRFFGQSRRFYPLFFLRAGRLRKVGLFVFDHRLGDVDDLFGKRLRVRFRRARLGRGFRRRRLIGNRLFFFYFLFSLGFLCLFFLSKACLLYTSRCV